MSELLGLAVALLIGAVLGLLGGGGSILATPAFAYVLGVEPQASIIASLVVVGVSSLIGGINNMRRRQVDLRSAALFVAGSIPGAFAGGTIGRLLDDRVQMILFAVVMIATAIAMLVRSPEPDVEPGDSHEARSASARQIAVSISIGAIVGMLTGIVGAGGGFLIVPAFTLLFGIPIRRAIATSMVVIAINSFAGLAGYLSDPEIIVSLTAMNVGAMSFPLYVGLFTVMTTAGVLVAVRFRSRVSAVTLRRLFASFLIVLGAVVFAINICNGRPS